MGIFTVSQLQLGNELYLHPSANGCNIDLTPVGEANNWQCVDDPRLTPDENNTYVKMSAVNALYDLYTLPNHTTESGTINYIQVYARAESHLYPQHADGIYKIILTEDACSNIYKSNNIDLLMGNYVTYHNPWSVNPRTAVAWTWADIDNLQIGVECSSPTVAGATVSSTFRPSAAGDLTELTPLPAPPNWSKVRVLDLNGTVFKTHTGGPVTATDLYGLDDHTTETGPITKVAIYIYCRDNNANAPLDEAQETIKIGGNTYYGSGHTLDSAWTLYSNDWLVNPDTGLAWTWADIDNLQAGIRLVITKAATSGGAYCGWMYAVVYYQEDISPEIRTTQVYAKVNYDSEVTCTLGKPRIISVSHDQNTKMLNFWSGDRAVYGEHRNKRTMVMQGTQYSEDACTIMECIRGLAENGSEVDTDGLGTTEFNNTFRIISFGYKKRTEKPLCFDWIIELEYA